MFRKRMQRRIFVFLNHAARPEDIEKLEKRWSCLTGCKVIVFDSGVSGVQLF